MRRILGGLLLALAGIFSYFALFVRWPVTRDVPWTAFLCFIVAIALMISGFRGATRKLWPAIVTTLGIALMVLFTFGMTVMSRQLPSSHGSPAIGAKAPDFTLPDANHRNITLSQLASAPGSNGVLLIFYRGYW